MTDKRIIEIDKICYVDPLYFLTHKLYDHKESSVHFHDIDDDYTETAIRQMFNLCNSISIELKEIVGFGIYSGKIYWMISRINESDFVVTFFSIATINATILGMFTFNSKDNISPIELAKSIYIVGKIWIINVDINEITCTIVDSEEIYFDNIEDFFGIIKNKIRNLIVYEKTRTD